MAYSLRAYPAIDPLVGVRLWDSFTHDGDYKTLQTWTPDVYNPSELTWTQHPNSTNGTMWIWPNDRLTRDDTTNAAWNWCFHPMTMTDQNYAIDFELWKEGSTIVNSVGRMGVILRCDPTATQGYFLVHDDNASKGWTLFVVSGGTFNEVANFVDQFTKRDSFAQCRFEVHDGIDGFADIVFTVDGVPVITYDCDESETFDAGHPGVCCYDDYEGQYIDNYVVRDYEFQFPIIQSPGLTVLSYPKDFPARMDPMERSQHQTQSFYEKWDGTLDSKLHHITPGPNDWNMGNTYGSHFANDEEQYYVYPADLPACDNPLSLGDYTDALGVNHPCANIRAKPTPAGQEVASGNRDYQSTMLTRFSNGNFLYGRALILWAAPATADKGLWSGLWTVPQASYTFELDIAEQFSQNNGRGEGGPGMDSVNFITRRTYPPTPDLNTLRNRMYDGTTSFSGPWTKAAGFIDGHSNHNWTVYDWWWTQNAIVIYTNSYLTKFAINVPYNAAGTTSMHDASHLQVQVAVGGEWPTNGAGGGVVGSGDIANWVGHIGPVRQFTWNS